MALNRTFDCDPSDAETHAKSVTVIFIGINLGCMNSEVLIVSQNRVRLGYFQAFQQANVAPSPCNKDHIRY